MMPRPSENMDNVYPHQSFARNRGSHNQQQPQQQMHSNNYNTAQSNNFIGAGAINPSQAPLTPHGSQQTHIGNNTMAQMMDQGMLTNTSLAFAGNQSPSMGGSAGPYAMGDMSPGLAHRMQLSANTMNSAGSSGMYNAHGHQMSGNQGNPSPNFAMEMDSRGLAAAAGASHHPGGNPNMTPAEREEDLLLNLLIARRQRGRLSGGEGRNSGPQGSLADELLRLRESRHATGANANAGALTGSSRGLPSVPGLPPLFNDTGGSVGVGANNAFGIASGNSMMGNTQGGYDAFLGMNMAAMQDASERIDRPTRLMDARTQEAMREYSSRGMKRSNPALGMGNPMEFNLKYPAPLGFDASDAPAKKKRTHKKKPADMPRRPLSAYNLFFSEERERILKEIDLKEGGGSSTVNVKEAGGSSTTEDVKGDDTTTKDGSIADGTTKQEGEEKDDLSKPKALMRPLIPAQKKRRPHRKTHGKISFQQLARMVGERWKNLEDDKRKYYQGLAEQDMKRQKIAMEEYYAKQNAKQSTAEVDETVKDGAAVAAADDDEIGGKPLEASA